VQPDGQGGTAGGREDAAYENEARPPPLDLHPAAFPPQYPPPPSHAAAPRLTAPPIAGSVAAVWAVADATLPRRRASPLQTAPPPLALWPAGGGGRDGGGPFSQGGGGGGAPPPLPKTVTASETFAPRWSTTEGDDQRRGRACPPGRRHP